MGAERAASAIGSLDGARGRVTYLDLRVLYVLPTCTRYSRREVRGQRTRNRLGDDEALAPRSLAALRSGS